MSDPLHPTEAEELERSLNRRFYLPRLKACAYQGHAVVHWSTTMQHRESGWLTQPFHSAFRELMLHAASREKILCPAYCLMLDHLHLVWMGLRPESDQRNGMAFLRTHLKKKLLPARIQHQAHDHVLRKEERTQSEFANVCLYVLGNPVRAGLVSTAAQWKYTGAVLPGHPALHPLNADFWEPFWKIYWKQRNVP
jgi:putative transposase